MENIKTGQENRGAIRAWIIILAMALLFVAWGIFIFFTVGDKGPPAWNFGAVQDIPGQSAYSSDRFRTGESPEPIRQHVSEKPTETGAKGPK